jgi:TolB-like protein
MEIKSNINPRKHLAFEFYNLYINLSERTVFRNKEQVKIPAKEFDILSILIEKNGDIATKDEILERIWKDSFVEEGNIAVHISNLRKLLGDNKSEPIVETISGIGYRFVPRLSEVLEQEWNRFFNKAENTIEAASFDKFKTTSIAVLPLKNESNNDEIDYLADGLTESFINSLSSETNLKVMSRNAVFQYKNTSEEIQSIGKQLGVETILNGRIRFVSERLILSIELIKVSDNSQIWGTQVNQPFSDIFEIQEKIISEISQTLVSQAKSNPANLEIKSIHGNQKSYREYLKGQFFYEKRTKDCFYKAIECFQNSMTHNPDNFLSYAGVIESYVGLYTGSYEKLDKVIEPVNALLELLNKTNRTTAELESAKGYANLYINRDFEMSERQFQNSLKLDPNCKMALHRYSNLLMSLGRFFDSLDKLKQYNLFDPFSPQKNRKLARVLLHFSQYGDAIRLLEESLEIDEYNFVCLLMLGIAYTVSGNHEKAMKSLEASYKLERNYETLAMMGYVYAHLGNKKKAIDILRKLEFESISTYIPPVFVGYIYMGLGETDKVFKCLEKAFKENDVEIINLKMDPRFIPIRKDPRFIDLLKKIGLPTD